MSVLPGNPAALADYADAYVRSASRISAAADELRGLAYESTARSLEGIRERSSQVARDLDRVHERYYGTASALSEYAVSLKTAHDRADDAEIDAAKYASSAAGAEFDLLLAERRLTQYEEADAPAGNISAAEREVASVRARAGRMDAAAEDARAEIEAARAAMEQAAQTAIDKINTAIDATNEGFWDKVGEFFDDIGDFLGDIGKWVGDFLADVYKELQRLMATVIALLGVAIILLLVYSLLALIPVIGPMIAMAVTVLLAGFLLGSVLSDILKPTPAVGKHELTESERGSTYGYPSGLAGAVSDAGRVDTLGKTFDDNGDLVSVDETVIGVTKVVDADGTVRWRVALPSTQEWLSRLNGDQGGVHDLDSNLALMLTPALRSQYERAVLEAMQQAGVGADDPVMLIGFSQGGIMAGSLAAYNNDYNWTAVVAAGAPIDHMPIPSSVSVVSVQHNGDPVTILDSIITVGTDGYSQNEPNWTTIETDSPDAHLGVHGIHNAEAYHQTLLDQVDQVPDGTVDELDRFFAGDENTYGFEQNYYGWSE
ncbi:MULTISPECIES: hypothetical protein [unclassified Microbacterium]|uniref:hypothetical protein n=1 Tax=unclassified Microbacterium TaxID=2609290 RepID=UPI00214B2E3F|nr:MULTISPECIES: hypothetical protein [unclassified Microbacterium]MCR2784262.1 hypothetical protein [Microbacterium sp. zg.B96]MDL5350830.1 hypothetical protein [Microbacterium sp. zg-YB36]WIM14909.1 hypothetical protein QNO11_10115 [Microbacterium sp. zg-B96]